MTDQSPFNPSLVPSGEGSLVVTFDCLGRVVSRREDYPVSAAAEGPAQCQYDEHGRVVRVTQDFHQILRIPGTP
jgi:hypothetical protein